MSNQTIIYDGHLPTGTGREFMYYKLEPLLQDLKNLWISKGYEQHKVDNIFKCPSFTGNLKNTFIYRSPYDVKVKYSENGRYQLKVPNDDCEQDHVKEYDPKTGKEENNTIQLFSGASGRFLFTEKSCSMTLVQPYFHNQKLTILGGSYDISKWFRPLHPAILNFNKEDIEFKRGDPLLYVQFPNHLNIKIVRTELDQTAYRITQGCTRYKIFKKQQPLERLYNHFLKTGYKKKLLKSLEENRID